MERYIQKTFEDTSTKEVMEVALKDLAQTTNLELPWQ